MNQSIQNGLNDLFDQIIPISGDFNKKTYADSFKNAYEKYKSLFTEIAQECENSEDRQEEIEEIAAPISSRLLTTPVSASVSASITNWIASVCVGIAFSDTFFSPPAG